MLLYEPVHASPRGSEWGQALSASSVGAVMGNGIVVVPAQKYFVNVNSWAPGAEMACKVKIIPQGVHLLIRRSSVRGSVLRCKEGFKLHHTKVFQGPSPKYMEVPL